MQEITQRMNKYFQNQDPIIQVPLLINNRIKINLRDITNSIKSFIDVFFLANYHFINFDDQNNQYNH